MSTPHDAPRTVLTPRRLVAAASAALLLVCGCGTGGAVTAAEETRPTPAGASAARPATPLSEGSAAPTTPSPSPTASAAVGPELPRGGRTVFPRYRLVGYAGLTGSPALGRLGIGDLGKRVDELEKLAAPYGQDRQVLPVMEIIATVVQADPGADGRYRVRAADATIARYLKEARAQRALLLLNIQPGRSEFLEEVQAYDRWLAEPDVGLALDPEWAMDAGQVPGGAFGRTTGAELDAVAKHVSGIVAENDLPEKVLVYHQLTPGIVRNEKRLRDREGVVLVKSVDGIGNRADKENTYRQVSSSTPDFVRPGFKIFFEEDAEAGPLMTPWQVLKLKPQPDYVMYE